MISEAYKSGNVPGPLTAVIVDGSIAGEIIKNAKNPLFVVGSMLATEEAGGKKLSEYAIDIAKRLSARGCVTITTANAISVFKDVKDVNTKIMGVVEVVDRLQDPNWGANGKPHDLVVFLGIHYWLGSQGLATLKHFAPHLRTLTLCFMNHPNADWSFPNMNKEDWGKALEEVIQKL
ncbi:CO dehydrogenase/acetyl-CoA synthase complex subunit epsilon [Candidatus Alkanophaga liquidiphilum]|nr:CO dehydrogenase/acetyl-CoA synthase epsilon subunit [Candidatus Alkanophaga liquidiphilum]RLG38250.1 MAG: CO dehydrogenase/acetyl-CoA synthase complex subunit epsilon [Candidatus Alkanophagales archaeon]